MLFSLTVLAAEICSSWDPIGNQLVFEDAPISESSGVTWGRLNPELYYTLDDEGNEAVLHLFNLKQEFLGDQLVRGAINTDWEDLAAGPCPESVAAESCLYIGDIGDNHGERESLTIFIIPESSNAAEDAISCLLKYPDNKHYDAETLLVDPEGVVRLVTKEGDGEAKVYRVDSLACDRTAQELLEEAELSLQGDSEEDRKVTGGAISEDGSQVVLRSYSKGWLFDGCPLNWNVEPVVLDLGSQPKGEGITFGEDLALVTTSEGTPFRVWELPCIEFVESPCKECGCGDKSGLILLVGLGLWRRRALGA
jgi:hypothetical protein